MEHSSVTSQHVEGLFSILALLTAGVYTLVRVVNDCLPALTAHQLRYRRGFAARPVIGYRACMPRASTISTLRKSTMAVLLGATLVAGGCAGTVAVPPAGEWHAPSAQPPSGSPSPSPSPSTAP